MLRGDFSKKIFKKIYKSTISTNCSRMFNIVPLQFMYFISNSYESTNVDRAKLSVYKKSHTCSLLCIGRVNVASWTLPPASAHTCFTAFFTAPSNVQPKYVRCLGFVQHILQESHPMC